MEIKHGATDEVLYADNSDTVRGTLESAAREGANLRGANLRRAYLAEGWTCNGSFHHVTNIGSEGGILELYSCGETGWFIRRGCFAGSQADFLAQVDETHGDNEHGRKYRALVAALCD